MIDLSKHPVYVVGASESPLGEVHDHTEMSMAAVAAREALAEAGLGFRDVDGLFTNYMGDEGTVQLGEYLRIEPRYADSTDVGGAAFVSFVHHAMVAIAAGRCEVALIAYASRQRTRRLRSKAGVDLFGGDDYSLMLQYEAPTGLPMPIGQAALVTARHMHERGLTREELAHVAVTARKWAMLNPKAFRHEPLTLDEVTSSPLLADPIRKLDCCLVTDGGGAIVMTSRERARDAAKKPIRVIGAGESHRQWHISQADDLTRGPWRASGRDAFAMAGIRPADVDVFEPYDAFTIDVIQMLEDLGFCEPGGAGPFVAEGNLAPGGKLPSMTSGGGLSYNHPGAFGLLLTIELVRQLRGEAGDRQVPGAKIGVGNGMGGLFSVGATVVMAHE